MTSLNVAVADQHGGRKQPAAVLVVYICAILSAKTFYWDLESSVFLSKIKIRWYFLLKK